MFPLLLITCLTLSLIVDQPTQEPSDCALRIMVDDVKRASAIYCKTTRTEDTRFIVTAYHAILNSEAVTISFDPRSIPAFPILNFVERKFVCVPEADLAVFRCTKEGIKSLEEKYKVKAIEVSKQKHPKGTRVIAIGNPTIVLFQGTPLKHLIKPLNIAASGSLIDANNLSVILGEGAASRAARQTPILFLETSQVERGFSGGPVIEVGRGDVLRLIGMIQGGDPKDPRRSWAIQSTEIEKAISNYGNATAYPPAPWPAAMINSEAFQFSAPQDVRSYLNPAIVQREEWPERTIKLSYHPGITLFKREPLVQGPNPKGDRASRQGIWEEWLYKGADSRDVDIAVYKSVPFNNYYKPMSGQIVFTDAPDQAKLADCVAFLVSIDQRSGMQILRQIDLSPGFKNMDAPPKKGLQNDFSNLIIDAGDTIVVVAQFAGLTNEQRRKGVSAVIQMK